MASRTRSWRTILGRLALSLVALVVAAVALVAAAERTERYRTVGRWRIDVARSVLDCARGATCRMHPGVSGGASADGAPYRFRINAQGFRGADVPVTRADPSALRVELYGDSMAFGLGVDEGHTTADHLAERLRQAFPGRPVEVLNFGLPMNYLHSNLRNYVDYGRAYRPDAVVFTNLFNDNPRDINYRAIQIRDSVVARALMSTREGVWLVNEWQRAWMPWYDRDEAEAALRSMFARVRDDQRATRMQVLLFDYFDVPTGAMRWLPADLARQRLGPGISQAEYRNGPYAIPRDGHPTDAGHAYFAARIADVLVPMLRGEPVPAAQE